MNQMELNGVPRRRAVICDGTPGRGGEEAFPADTTQGTVINGEFIEFSAWEIKEPPPCAGWWQLLVDVGCSVMARWDSEARHFKVDSKDGTGAYAILPHHHTRPWRGLVRPAPAGTKPQRRILLEG